MMIVFSKSVWMNYYKGNYDGMDLPALKGYSVGPDTENFKPVPIGPELTREFYCFGYMQFGNFNRLSLDRIAGHYLPDNVESIDNVLVVFYANSPAVATDGMYVVGWYENATVYRSCQKRIIDAGPCGNYTSYYYFSAKRDDCVLLPIENRCPGNNWSIPLSSKNVNGFGVGMCPIWYADNTKENGSRASLEAFKTDIIYKITHYSGDNWINKYHA